MLMTAEANRRQPIIDSRILFLNRWAQHRSPDRWDNELARPEMLIDHDFHRVTYICDGNGRFGVPADAADVHIVDDITNVATMAALVERLISEDGPFDHIIALSEYLLDTAAELRQRYGIPGQTPTEVARFRDKTVMKSTLEVAGIRVPRWSAERDVDRLLIAAESLGYPVIFKPIRGAGSQGVRKVQSAQELRALCHASDLCQYEIEEYVAGDVMHTDGVVDAAGECLFIVTSRYLANCLAFENGEPFGSVIQTDPDQVKIHQEFARTCIDALGLRNSAFHLEYFDTGQELVFLEIGARVPGADVPYVVRDVTGVNMFQLWVDALLGNPTVRPLAWPADSFESGGWLMIPRPRPLPRKVLSATSLVGEVPFLYRELVPSPGDVLTDLPGSYANLQGGRFLFRGGSEAQIWEAVRRTQAAYQLTTEPIRDSGSRQTRR
jgi:hypothetical protein